MRQIWESNYRRIVMACYAEKSQQERDEYTKRVSDYMKNGDARFFRIEATDGTLMGYYVQLNSENVVYGIRPHFNNQKEEVLKLISNSLNEGYDFSV